MRNLEGVKVGDSIIHFGTQLRGIIVETTNIAIPFYPLIVTWEDGNTGFYTMEGLASKHNIFPSIGFAMPEITYAPRPKRKVKKDITVYANAYPGERGNLIYISEDDAKASAGLSAIAIAVPLTGTYEVEE